MASIRKRGDHYFVRYIDSQGKQREKKAFRDKRESERLAASLENEAAKIRAGLIDPRELAWRDHEAKPLADHLADFRAYLEARGVRTKHPQISANRITKLFAMAKFRKLSDITLAGTQRALGQLRTQGMATETVNHHVTAVKAFSSWLWKDARTRDHRLAHLVTTSSEADKKRRRALTPAECARLIDAAMSGPIILGITGEHRAMAYQIAIGTGFRAEEIASLTPERFDLDADVPTARIPSCYTKNQREAIQPISRDLAEAIRQFIRFLPAGKPILELPHRTADMIRFDLNRAGIPHTTDEGVIDFHATRVTFITRIVESGASVRDCMELARHSNPQLTIGTYARTTFKAKADIVATLPAVSPALNESTPSLPQPFLGDSTCSELTHDDSSPLVEMAETCDETGLRKPLGKEHVDSIWPDVTSVATPIMSHDGMLGGNAFAGNSRSSARPTSISDSQRDSVDSAETQSLIHPYPCGQPIGDPDLGAVVTAWAKLSQEARQSILAIIRVAEAGK